MALKDTLRDHFVAFIGEFVGTFLFLFFAFAATQTGSQVTTTVADPAKLLYISSAFGFSLAINVWIFFRVSGGLFNPAVTLALFIAGIVPFVRSAIVIVSQVAGGMAAAIIVKVILPGDEVLFAVGLGPKVTVTQGFFIEAFLTFELVFTILMLAGEKTKATFIAPIGIGIALFIGHLVGVFWTGAGINPARAFGPAVALLTFPDYHWIYWVGPILGATVAAGFYLMLKKLHYEEVNGNQDKSADEQSLVDHTERMERTMKSWTDQRRSSVMWRERNRDTPEPLRLYRLSGLDAWQAPVNPRYPERKVQEEIYMEEGRIPVGHRRSLSTVDEDGESRYRQNAF